jgi:hypothetical protein
MEGRELIQQLEIEHMAASTAQQFIEEAKSRRFDEVIIPATMPGSLTAAGSLGVEGEAYPAFDDVDDFAAINADTLFVSGIDFIATVDVDYVQDTAPDDSVGVQTFFKRMRVSVKSSWLPAGREIRLQHIFTYFGV